MEKEEERSKREMEIDKEGEERKRSLERPRVSIPPPDNRLLSEKSSLLSATCCVPTMVVGASWSSRLPCWRGVPEDRFSNMQLSSGLNNRD